MGNGSQVVAEDVVNCPASSAFLCSYRHSSVSIAANPDVLRGGATRHFALATATKIIPGSGGDAVGLQGHAYALPVGIIHEVGGFCAFGYGFYLVKGIVNNALRRGGNIQPVGDGLQGIFPRGVIAVGSGIGFGSNIPFNGRIVGNIKYLASKNHLS
ncbi:MAG: hypothetical protein BWY65_02376 [Firmicutes bacterium ADurb.Bin373]|nr:MAG: hypothetical protein BWY65_02376 [Firmicutes bacterium ADurb.Bin373]